MMKQTIIIAFVFFSGAFLRADDSKYAPQGKKFEVVFPDKPTETDIGKGQGKMLILPAEANKAVYIFYHNAFPKEVDVNNKETAETIFKSGLEGGLRTWK